MEIPNETQMLGDLYYFLACLSFERSYDKQKIADALNNLKDSNIEEYKNILVAASRFWNSVRVEGGLKKYREEDESANDVLFRVNKCAICDCPNPINLTKFDERYPLEFVETVINYNTKRRLCRNCGFRW